MKNNHTSRLLLCCLLLTARASAQTCTGNLLQNPGFENSLAHWNTLAGDPTVVAGGQNSANALRFTQATDEGIIQTLPATSGQTYTVQFFGKVEPGNGNGGSQPSATVWVKFMSASYQKLFEASRPVPNTTWTAATLAAAVPPGTAWIEVKCAFSKNSGSTARCFLDDLCLTVPNTPTCSISAAASNIACQDNNTPADPTDDTFTFSVKADRSSGCSAFWKISGQPSVFSYDNPQNFGPYPIANGSVTLNIEDETGSATTTVTAAPPPACSTGNACDTPLGIGEVVCVSPVAGSTNLHVLIHENGQRLRKTLAANGQVISTENIGPANPPTARVNIVGGNSLQKINADGSVAYTKPFTPALANSGSTFSAAIEFGTGFVLLVWKAKTGNPSFFLDSLFGIRTDAALNILHKKLLAIGTGLPGDNSSYALTQTTPNRAAFLKSTGTSTARDLVLIALDEAMNIKSQKTLAPPVFAVNGTLRPNICRGFTVTDNIGFNFCKSGACYQSDRFEGEFVADTLQPYNHFLTSEISQVGVGTRIYRWSAATSDGGTLRASRVLTGQLSQIVNDTIVLKKYDAAGAFLWEQNVNVPGAHSVNRLFEASGQIYLFKSQPTGEQSVALLNCYAPPPPPPSTCAANILQNPGFENGLTNWEGSGGTVSNIAASGAQAVKLCQNTTLRQTRPATPGQQLTLTFKAVAEPVPGRLLSYIKYLSAAWQPLVTEFFDFPATNTGFLQGTVSKLAPAGTAWVEIGFLKETSGCTHVDDVCLSAGGSGPSPCAPDLTPPILVNCPTNITQTTPGTSANVTWVAPTVTDNCPGTVGRSSNIQPGSNFPIGSTTVVYTANDTSGNTATCAFQVTVQPQTGGGPDLKLAITADKTTVPQWGTVTYQITATNEGTAAFSSVAICVLLCTGNPDDVLGVLFINQNGIVYAGPPAAPTAGSYNQVTNLWTLTNFAPGQTATLTLRLFTLGTAEKKVFAFALAHTPDDVDSQPANLPANCLAAQDDEAVWTINAGQTLKPGQTRSNPDGEVLEKPASLKFFPNPAGESVFLHMADFVGMENVQVAFFNDKGLIVKSLAFDKVAEPSVEVPLSDFQNGVYFVRFLAANRRPTTAKLAVQRTF